MTIVDQIRPVWICTDATFWMLMLISSLLNHDRLRRITALSETSMMVGKRWLPAVHRLAWNVSDAMPWINRPSVPGIKP